MKSRCATMVLLLSAVFATGAEANSLAPYREQGRVIAGEFARALKQELMQAMEQGGPSGAVEVCRTAAPVIAEDCSRRHGVSVRRVTLRYRNPANRPDAWEEKQLQQAEALVAGPREIRRQELVASDASCDPYSKTNEFRYMKFIYTEALCLTCHGKEIDPGVAAILNREYPDDRAVGYGLDELRGAISIRFPAGAPSAFPRPGNP